MKTLRFLPIIVFILSTSFTLAQVNTNFNNSTPISEKGLYGKFTTSDINYELPAKDLNELFNAEAKERAASGETKPFQLAVPVAVELNLAKLIRWVYDGEWAYGKYTIRLNGALSASINFNQFKLPSGAELYVYNENGNMITGPVTDKENNANNKWGSWVYKGSWINIEIKVPVATMDQLQLHANNLAYGYKEIYKTKVNDFGASGGCNINVLCPLGTGWEPERNSVALILNANGSSWCSGSMIMNTGSSDIPYLLTANHCYATSPVQDVTAWRFTFQAWSPTCTPSQNSNGITFNGSTLRANWASSDFALVELNNKPACNSGIYHAGWNRSSSAAANATGIHHPSGDVMKISYAGSALSVASAFGTSNQHWRANWSQGVTEGGSSGSPLFDPNHRIVGQLHGGPSACGASNLWDFYGRFDLSWTGGGTNNTRLSNWLDPTNSGVLQTNTTNVGNLAPSSVSGMSISGPSYFCTNATYTLNGAPSGTSVSWSILHSTLASISAAGNTATLTASGSEGWTTTLTASIINNCSGQIIRTVSITIGVASYVYSPVFELASAWCGRGNKVSVNCRVTDYPAAATYEWYIDEVLVKTTTTNETSINFGVQDCQTHILNCRVISTQPCGAQVIYNVQPFATFNATCPGGCTGEFRVWPNPASDVINIEVPEGQTIFEVRIKDRTGIQQMQTRLSARSQFSLNISRLSPNIYSVEIFDGKTWRASKFIKQ